MNAELKAQWLTDLRSGEYTQAPDCLKGEDGYCCLGVLIQSAKRLGKRITKKRDWEYLDTPSLVRLGCADIDQEKLATMNDAPLPFKEIADYIERTL